MLTWQVGDVVGGPAASVYWSHLDCALEARDLLGENPASNNHILMMSIKHDALLNKRPLSQVLLKVRSPQKYCIRSKKSYKKYLSDLKSVVTLLWGLVCLFALERVLLELSYQRFCLKSVGEGLMYDSLQSDQIQQFAKKNDWDALSSHEGEVEYKSVVGVVYGV